MDRTEVPPEDTLLYWPKRLEALEERVANLEYEPEKSLVTILKKINERVATLEKGVGFFMDLKGRVAALEKAYASWLPDWAATQERVARLEKQVSWLQDIASEAPPAGIPWGDLD